MELSPSLSLSLFSSNSDSNSEVLDSDSEKVDSTLVLDNIVEEYEREIVNSENETADDQLEKEKKTEKVTICNSSEKSSNKNIGTVSATAEKDDKEDDGIKRIVKKLEQKFLKKKDDETIKPILSNTYGFLNPKEAFSVGPIQDFLKGFYGGNNVKTDAYKEHYEEGSTKLADRYIQESKFVDIGYQDVMSMVWTNIKNSMLTGGRSTEFVGTEQISATLKEKWNILKIFPTFYIQSMLSYQAAFS